MKTTNLLISNYVVFMLIAFYFVYNQIKAPHHFDYSIRKLNDLVENLNKSLQFKVVISENLSMNPTKARMDEIIKRENLITKAEYEKEYQVMKDYSLYILLHFVILRINLVMNCDETSTNKLFHVANLLPIQVSFSGSCVELNNSAILKREFKRVLTFLGEDFSSESNIKYYAEIFLFDINLIYSIQTKKNITEVSNKIAQIYETFINALNLSENEYRISIKHYYLEDIQLGNNLENAHDLLLDFEINHSSYIFESERFTFNIILGNEKEDLINEIHDFIEDKTDKILTLNIFEEYGYEETVISAIYRMLELFKFDSGENLANSLQKMEFTYDIDIIFQQFEATRRVHLIKKIIKEIIGLEFLMNDSEIMIPEEFEIKLLGLLKFIEIDSITKKNSYDLKKLYRELWSINHNSNSNYGKRDTFPFDYQIGLFLPLLLPIFYPLIQILKEVIGKIKRKNKAS